MILSILKEAWISMSSQKLRSFLTTLGIIIGVSAVVMMVAAGKTVEQIIENSLSSIGTNLIVVLPGAANNSGVRMGLGSTPTLTRTDADAIAQLPHVEQVAPVVTGGAQIVSDTDNWSTGIIGTTNQYLTASNWDVDYGRSFTDSDIRSAENVALIGQTVAHELFNNRDPVGRVIRINNIPFQIIGLLSEKGQSLNGSDQDDIVVVPLTTARQRITGSVFPDNIDFIYITATDRQYLSGLVEDITQLLRARHRIRADQDDDFNVRNLTVILNTITTIARVLSILLATIASISLLVGSIGIMNMMLVSVTERTREIGLRKAIGAPDKSIMLQFLLETLMISFIGCFLGMLVGVGITQLAGILLHTNVSLSWWPIVLSFITALIVGISSGFFPALKATRLDPIKALRYQ